MAVLDGISKSGEMGWNGLKWAKFHHNGCTYIDILVPFKTIQHFTIEFYIEPNLGYEKGSI